MISIAYEFGSNDDHPFGINPLMLDEGNRNALWDEIHELAESGQISGLLLHRLMGEFRPGDLFDFDALWQIAQSGDQRFIAFAQHMIRRLINFATTFPKVRIDYYLSALNHSRMRRLIEQGNLAEWNNRVDYELTVPLLLLQLGSNTRIVFDHSATFQPHRVDEHGATHSGYEVQKLLDLNTQYPKRIVLESIPDPLHPLAIAGLPALAVERRYLYLAQHQPDWISSAAHITRLTNGHDDRDPVEFVRECAQLGHTPVVSARKLERLGMTFAQLVDRVRDAGRPQEVA